MARSIGEGIATGLESGFRLAMDSNRQQNYESRQRAQDAIAAEDRQRTITRQDHADQLAALNEAEAALKQEGSALQAQGSQDPVAMQSLTERWGKVRQAKAARIKELTGYDLIGTQDQAKIDLQDIQKTQDVSALSLARSPAP